MANVKNPLTPATFSGLDRYASHVDKDVTFQMRRAYLYKKVCPSVSPSVRLSHFLNISGSTNPMKLKFSGNEPPYI